MRERMDGENKFWLIGIFHSKGSGGSKVLTKDSLVAVVLEVHLEGKDKGKVRELVRSQDTWGP